MIEIDCEADFPDDIIWNEDETQVLRTGGMAAATAIAEILTSRGMEVEGPEDHLEHGWELWIKSGDRRFWVQFTDLGTPEAIILARELALGFFAKLRGKKSNLTEFVRLLKEALAGDGRFRFPADHT